MKILVINGPNLNMLGKREAKHYGEQTLKSIETALSEQAEALGCALGFFQSNSEGSLIDFIQTEAGAASGIIINAGALTHYGYSLHDALLDCGLPVVEVHMSNISSREDWRQKSVFADVTIGQISGFKEASYSLALTALTDYIGSQRR